ncbi:type I-U CRISPR-associated protein Csx17 [Mycobacterium sp. MYCO198283]|uniref:type I-G CRISPR-associated protein Cas8g1/Csx17 n=1 Tax=Mycobacterium sp. MYCO198283 TaxID=2883505 RepID=UPI001E3EFBA6|nr:type I-U CRISPR-associated protein Csx17 [Mycobacterium sp. MYCO198283]MCG5432773.1 type I-U CRISPR-associated protein Csx17 [Mycobacterium sp. MYCO198283]
MAEVALEGCRVTSLSGYLSALGVHRAVHRLFDPRAAGRWHRGTYVLGSRFPTMESLVEAVSTEFAPESIVSPWNLESGFAPRDKPKTAERILQWVRTCTDPRLNALKLAVAAADRVVLDTRHLELNPWDKSKKKDKAEFIKLCRNELPDAAVAWLDAAIALAQSGDLTYAPILGSGGNFGRQELSATYLQQVQTVLQHSDSPAWLACALDGRNRVKLSKSSPGQFDPGGAKAPDQPNTISNPWTTLFVIEGTLLFATAMVRRHGSSYAGAALPFQVTGSRAGFSSAAAGERPEGEMWAPEWTEPLRIPDMMHLLGEGRADWNSKPARSGLEMARSAATLGVDRGISAFNRYVFVERLGQSSLALPAGRIEVRARGGVDLLAPLDRWCDALRRSDPPAYTAARLRSLDQAVFDHARTGSPASLAAVFAALGRCRSAAFRSGKVRAASLPELRIDSAGQLFDQLRDATEYDRELRIALALASARDPDTTLSAALRDSLLGGGLVAGLADIARRRGFPLATQETVTDQILAVRGARIVFQRGMRLRSGDIAHFVGGTIDDERAAGLTLGLCCVDWRRTEDHTLSGPPSRPDPTLDLLSLFAAARPLAYTDLDGALSSLFVRPGHRWPGQLLAGHTTEVLQDASRRLRLAGLRHVISVPSVAYDGVRLAAALLMTTPTSDRQVALGRVAVVRSRPAPSIEEESA